MRNVINALGLKAEQSAPHEHHFHVDFRTPDRVKIDGGKPKQLLGTDEEAVDSLFKADAEMQELIEEVHTELGFQPGETNMLTLDSLPVALPAIAFVAKADAITVAKNERIMGVCALVPYLAPGEQVGPGAGGDMPNDWAREYFSIYEKREMEIPPLRSVEVIMQPKHGTIVIGRNSANRELLQYIPNAGFVGKDRIEYRVIVGGTPIKLVYFVNVTKKNLDTEKYSITEFCKANTWKISSTDPQDRTDFTNWQTTASLNALLANASQALTGYADLSGTAVGQTTGEGPAAQITLDNNAAGHGWFIDATPDDNAEFLPTADANIWQAKAGSLAAGKMDMLSVLLHEYGHALGIEHSADSRDFMAQNLQAGQRRLPTAVELTLMSQLVAALKPERVSADNADSTGAPQPLPRPYDPSLPLGGGFAFMAMGRLRRSDYGWSLNLADGQNILAPANAKQRPQSQTAINSTLGHNANDWQSAGNLSHGQGTVTLGENVQTNAHLSQSFAVKQGDRYLSFTVANNGLQANDLDADGNESNQYGGPSDAFEVALLNADSGLSVAGSDGLSNSDAILNIQTDGSENRAAGVRKVHNADGSDTYYVDLQQAVNQSNGSVTGTPVTLSFDLIGFGADVTNQRSQVSLRDIQLIQDPVALDDIISSDEDATLVINPLDNDLLGGGVAASTAQRWLGSVTEADALSASINRLLRFAHCKALALRSKSQHPSISI